MPRDVEDALLQLERICEGAASNAMFGGDNVFVRCICCMHCCKHHNVQCAHTHLEYENGTTSMLFFAAVLVLALSLVRVMTWLCGKTILEESKDAKL
jgi:hypothetical protein